MNRVKRLWFKNIRPMVLNLSVGAAIIVALLGICCLDSEGFLQYIITGGAMLYLFIVVRANS